MLSLLQQLMSSKGEFFVTITRKINSKPFKLIKKEKFHQMLIDTKKGRERKNSTITKELVSNELPE